MIGSFLTRGLVMIFGYAYPAYECFKTVEKNKPDIEQLRFWCQYWILVALMTVGERIGDAFVSWVPMYSEAKLAFFIYLWYPKTKGTTYVYDSFFKPYVSKHENEIDRNLTELRARAGDMAVLYFQRAASYGQTRVFEILQYVASQSPPKPQTSQTHQPAPRARQPATRAANPPQPARSSQPPPPVQNEDPPSPTSSTSSAQHQKEIRQELSSLQAPSKAAAPPAPVAPSLRSSPRRMLSAPVNSINGKAGQPLDSEISSSTQSKLKKADAQLPGPQSSDQSGSNEAELMQIEPPGGTQLDKASSQPTPPETIMEEAIRVTRGRLRKTRSTTK